MIYDPAATPRIRYQASAQLRSGLWSCPKLPFPINDLSASLAVRDGVLTIERAEGYNGSTVVRIPQGTIVLGDPERAPLDLRIDILDLELDQRLRDWTPKPARRALGRLPPVGAAERGLADRPRARGRAARLRHGHRLPRRRHGLQVLQVPARPRPGPDHLARAEGEPGPPDARRRQAAQGEGDDRQPRRPGPRHARLRGRGTADRRDAVQRLAPRHLQGRQGVPADRLGRGPRARRSDAAGPPRRPSRGGRQIRRRARAQRGLRDEVGGASLPGLEPDRSSSSCTPTTGCSRTCGAPTVRRSSRVRARSNSLPPTSSRSTSASRARACRSTTSCGKRCRRPGRRPWPRSTRTARATWTRRSRWRRGSPTFTTW